MRSRLVAFLCSAFVVGAGADQARLTTEEVEAAIRSGAALSYSQIGIRLHESNPFSTWSQIRFGLTVHSPVTWVQYLTSRAAYDGRPLQASAVSEADRVKYLRVFVRPGMMVRQVALITPGERLPQAIRSSACSYPVSFSAVGPDSVDPICGEWLFDWNEVLTRTDNGQREFEVSVTVVGETLSGSAREIRKSFKIKKEHLQRVNWTR